MSDAKTESLSEDQTNHYKELYKFSERDLAYTQEERRRQFLAAQKEKRSAAFDEKRDINQLLLFDENGNRNYRRRRRQKCPFEHKFMQAEWLVFPPEDLAESWLAKPCPEGVRVLVIANKGITKCYVGNRIICQFNSTLPGGNSEQYKYKFTILDCVYHRASRTFFVFDLLAWNSVSLLDAECALRFFWLKSHFDEDPNLGRSKCKRFNFTVVDPFPAETSLIQEQMSTPCMIAEHALYYEGVLFYHKEGHYEFGLTPLVLWVKPFMLPEILNIDVDEYHMRKRPRNYENILQFLTARELKQKRRMNIRRKAQDNDNNMDTKHFEQPEEKICDNMEESSEDNTLEMVLEEMKNLEQESIEDVEQDQMEHLDQENIEFVEKEQVKHSEQENVEDSEK